jgi:penicillin-binding protein 1C
VWTGNFSGQGVAELSGANIATPLLFRIFNTIDYDSDEEWFQQPADCQARIVCSETGRLPGQHCTQLVSDYFIPLVSPTQTCSNMQEVMVSANETISYCKACAPAAGYKQKLYKVIAPDLQAWMRDNGIAYQRIPPHNPACERVFLEGGPIITSPSPGIEYLLSRKHPEPIQLSCRSTTDAGMLYWYVNNKFYKSCAPGSKQFLLPEEGLIKISCSDDRGRNKDVWITVKYADL